MKKVEIDVAVSKEKIITSKYSLNLPEKPTFYSMNDDGNFFPRGLILFAFFPKYESNPTKSYILIQVERNKQDSNDFVPMSDCKSGSWLNESGIRKTGFEILTCNHPFFKEISEEDFYIKRESLLNSFKEI